MDSQNNKKSHASLISDQNNKKSPKISPITSSKDLVYQSISGSNRSNLSQNSKLNTISENKIYENTRAGENTISVENTTAVESKTTGKSSASVTKSTLGDLIKNSIQQDSPGFEAFVIPVSMSSLKRNSKTKTKRRKSSEIVENNNVPENCLQEEHVSGNIKKFLELTKELTKIADNILEETKVKLKHAEDKINVQYISNNLPEPEMSKKTILEEHREIIENPLCQQTDNLTANEIANVFGKLAIKGFLDISKSLLIASSEPPAILDSKESSIKSETISNKECLQPDTQSNSFGSYNSNTSSRINLICNNISNLLTTTLNLENDDGYKNIGIGCTKIELFTSVRVVDLNECTELIHFWLPPDYLEIVEKNGIFSKFGGVILNLNLDGDPHAYLQMKPIFVSYLIQKMLRK